MANPFDDYGTVSGSGPGFKPRTDGDFVRMKQRVGDALLEIIKQSNSLRQLSTGIGTSSDSEALRTKIDNVRHSTLNRMQSVSLNCHQLFQLAETEPDRLAAKNMLGKFQKAVKDFEDINENTAERLRRAYTQPPPEVSSSRGFMDSGDLVVDDDRARLVRSPGVTSDEASASGYGQQQADQMYASEDEISQRAERMQDIERNIVTIHEIMRDLQQLVVEQGETIDTIEQNVEEGYRKVGQANQELNTAVRLKKCSRRMICFIGILVISILIALAIIIAILASVLRNKN